MTFIPIVSLMDGLPGIKHLANAIDLYLECKILFKTLWMKLTHALKFISFYVLLLFFNTYFQM